MALVEFQNNEPPYLNAENLNNNFTECNNIIDSGSNANGSWIKYSDGTMICWQEISGSQFSCRTSGGANRYYYEDDNAGAQNLKEWTYPIEFYSKPVCSCVVQSNAYTMTSMGTTTKTKAIAYCALPYAVSSVTFLWQFIAIGRWEA